MKRNYIEDRVGNILLENKIVLGRNEVDSIIDSILFDWNELGDPEADFEEMVSWNVDQYLSHNTGNELKRISRNEARKLNLKRFSYKFKNENKEFGGYAALNNKKISIVMDIGTPPSSKFSSESELGSSTGNSVVEDFGVEVTG